MVNIASLLAERLPPPRYSLLKAASRAAAHAGVELYLVGGSVRDALLGNPPADLDVSAVGAADGFIDTLARALGGEVASRSRFGTARLRAGRASLDVALARRETYSGPGALPSVEPGSLEDDLARRDFSINAMAVSLTPAAWGELTDSFDGAGDLERRIVRVLHPSSFQDDPTRLFRAVRYAGRLGFRLDGRTEVLLRAGAAFLDAISGDRIRHELERIFEEEQALSILLMADRLGLLKRLHPALRVVDEAAEVEVKGEAAILAGLARSLSAEDAAGLSARLNLSGEWARVVTDTAAVRESLGELGADIPPSRVYAVLHGRHEASIAVWAALAGPGAAENIGLYLTSLSRVSTSLSGRDVIDMGMSEGPAVGDVLRDVLKARLDGVVDSADAEREMVRRRISAMRSGA